MNTLEKYIDNFNYMIRISHSYSNKSLASELEDEIIKLKKNYFYLAVIGQIKRGKSTLINALLGTELLPSAVLPLTSIVTMIRYGEKIEIKIVFKNDEESLIPRSELKNYITEAGNPDNHKKVKYVEITYPSEFIKEGIVLIDTPGIGSLFLHNTASTEKFIPKIDAAVFVLSVDPPITETESGFLAKVYNNINTFFFVLNKTDLASDENLEQIIKYTSGILQKFKNVAQVIYPVSSLYALQARISNNTDKLAKSRITDLETAIKKIITNERTEVLENNLRRKSGIYISQLNFLMELELKALQTPVNIFERKINDFNNEMEKISEEKILILHFFTEQTNKLITKIEKDIEGFSINNKETFYESLQYFLGSSASIKKINLVSSSRVFLTDLLSRKFEEWRLNFEQTVYKEYSAAVGDSTAKVNKLIKQIIELSAGLFNISAPLYFEELNINLPAEFFYYTEDPTLFLEINLLKTFSLLLPKKFLSRLIIKKMEKEIDEKLMINSGKIMSFYKSLITDSSLKFRYNMDNKISQVISYINNIILNAQEDKKLNELSIEPKLKKIQDDLYALRNLN